MLQKQSSDLSGLKQKRVYFLFKLHVQQETLRDAAQRLALPALLDTADGQPLPDPMASEKYNCEGSHMSNICQTCQWYSSLARTQTDSATESQEVQFLSCGWKAECEKCLVSSDWLWGTTLVLALGRATLKPSAHTATSERSGGSRDRETSQMFWWYRQKCDTLL